MHTTLGTMETTVWKREGDGFIRRFRHTSSAWSQTHEDLHRGEGVIAARTRQYSRYPAAPDDRIRPVVLDNHKTTGDPKAAERERVEAFKRAKARTSDPEGSQP
jgi:hypothetical protein